MSTIPTSTLAPLSWPLRFGLFCQRELLFWLVIVQLVGGLYLQSQMALFDGRIVLPNLAPKFLLVANVVLLGAAIVLERRGHISVRACFLPSALLACYLIWDAAYLLIAGDAAERAMLFGINKFYLFYLMIPAACLMRPQFGEKWLVGRLTLLFLPLLMVAFAQYAYNDPLMPIVSDDGSYKIPAADFYGQNRSFSLFRGVLEFGQCLAFFAALVVARIVVAKGWQRCWLVPLALLAAAGCYVTFRRGAYLEFGAAGFSALAIAKTWQCRRWLPWVYMSAGLVLAGGGTLLGTVSSETVLSSETLLERQEAWKVVLERWLMKTDASLMFGTGLSQIEPDDPDSILVDNAFLSVGMQIGLVGLALWCWVMHALWRDLLAMADRTHGLLPTAAAALLSTWMLRGVFDPMFAWYPLYAFLAWWTWRPPALAPARAARSRAKYQLLQGVLHGSSA